MNSLWLVVGALAAFAVAYRYYGAFLAAKVAVLDDRRATPAHRLRDGVDYHPTNKYVLFGHHFAAIAGPGPLIGPVLAAQWGFLPGFVWIVVGACLAGAVHDFVILLASVRQDGLSLPKLARGNIGEVAGVTASIATLFIVVATLASVAMVVVKTLAESSWGMFTIVVTVPAALLTGLWMYRIRPGKVGEASAVGVTIVILGVLLGKPFADSAFGHTLLFNEMTLKLMLPAYGAIASILPVWVLMCPRDYLSSYMKVGVVVLLAAGIFAVRPVLRMPATTPFLDGTGPVIPGPVWPMVCITIMCGAVSGFHSLIASGTTPKMIYKERDIRPIGYGAMILEGFVSIMALIAACALEPADYFAINVAQGKPAEVAKYEQMLETAHSRHGWDLKATEGLQVLEEGTGETAREGKGGLRGRTGGAVTLAVGMSKVFSSIPGLRGLMGYFYHFVIMFEALFILTLLETGTRVARFVFQETLGQLGGRRRTQAAACPADTVGGTGRKPNWTMNIVMSVVTCFCWGFLLYLGDLKTLWSMLGIANQLLAGIALAIATTYLLRTAAKRVYALCTGLPCAFVLVTTFVAGVMKIVEWLQQAPGRPPAEAFLLRLATALAAIMLILTAVIAADTVRCWTTLLGRPHFAPAPAVVPLESEP